MTPFQGLGLPILPGLHLLFAGLLLPVFFRVSAVFGRYGSFQQAAGLFAGHFLLLAVGIWLLLLLAVGRRLLIIAGLLLIGLLRRVFLGLAGVVVLLVLLILLVLLLLLVLLFLFFQSFHWLLKE